MRKFLSLLVVLLTTLTSAWAETKEVSTADALTSAVSNAANGDVIKLTADIDLTAVIDVASGKDFTLDLNGYVLKQTTAGKRVIDDAGTLTIKDSNPNEVHNFKVDANGLWTLTTDASTKKYEDLTARPAENDVIAVKGGCITGGRASGTSRPYYNGGAIQVTGTLNIQGGNIVGNKKDGYGYCAGVFVNAATAKVTMSAGRICGNFADYRDAGGIYLAAGTLTATGGEISYNNTTSSGGGICTGGGTMELDGCKISYNKANEGGGLYLYPGTTTVKGSTEISYNEATYYGGIRAVKTSTLKLLGGKVINNKAEYYAGVSIADKNVTVGGTVVVKDNILTDGTAKSDIAVDWYYSTFTFNISTETPLAEGANIGISASKARQFTTNGSADDAKYFFADDAKYVLQYNTNHLELALPVTLDEAATAYPEAGVWDENQIYNISLNRTLSASKWNTLMLPFPMTADEVTANFGAGAKVMKMTGVENYVVKFETATDMDICEAYIVQPAADVTKIEVKGKTGLKNIVFEDRKSLLLQNGYGHAYRHFNTWEATSSFNKESYNASQMSDPMYVLSGNKFYLIKSDNVEVKGYRWMFGETGPAPSAKQSLSISFDGDIVTGIENVDVDADVNLNGKYLKDGKLVIVKDGKTYNAAGQEIK